MEGLGTAPLLLLMTLAGAYTVVIGEGDICQLPPKTGPCKAAKPRYFYNSTSGHCEKFSYGGCQGNDNRFHSKKRCLARCTNGTAFAENTCEQPAEPGMCLGYFPRFFYNWRSGQCQPFVYGGCGGNDNRFQNITECQAVCAGQRPVEDVCQLPAEPGMCRAYKPSYFYNSTSGQCEVFVYGGCGGNGNRFWRESECQAKCSRQRPNEEVEQRGEVADGVPELLEDSGHTAAAVACGWNPWRCPTVCHR